VKKENIWADMAINIANGFLKGLIVSIATNMLHIPEGTRNSFEETH